MKRKLKSCGVLVVQGDPVERFLLMVHAHRLDLPKGHVEPNETELECALRELEEETGLTADLVEIDPHFRFETQYEVRPSRFQFEPCEKTTVIFLGRLRREAPILVTEHRGFEWWPWNPPHRIQAETIDPLLAELTIFLDQQ